jgi:hypothetical protein
MSAASAEPSTIELSVVMPSLNEAETLALRGGIEAANGRWILMGYSPHWLFLVPGLILTALGALASAWIFLAPRHVGGIEFDAGSLLVACMGSIVGVQLVAFACFTKAFAIAEGLLPEDPKFAKALRLITLERGLIAGLLISLTGAALLAWSIYLWSQVHFGSLPYPENLRRLILAVTLIIIGLQTVFSSFFLGVLGLKTAAPGHG